MDVEDFRGLYDSFGAECYRIARRIITDSQLAEDVVQNVFLAVWRGDAVFDASRGSIRGWLLAITHHKAVDAVRHNDRHSRRASTDEALAWLPAQDDVEKEGWQQARRSHVAAAMVALSDVQRQVITLAYFGGYTQVEIAKLTDTALGTVKTRTLAALRQLRQNLDLSTLANDEGWLRPGPASSAA
jgi:RNA polymerase sigma factor (sigma-70 family)